MSTMTSSQRGLIAHEMNKADWRSSHIAPPPSVLPRLHFPSSFYFESVFLIHSSHSRLRPGTTRSVPILRTPSPSTSNEPLKTASFATQHICQCTRDGKKTRGEPSRKRHGMIAPTKPRRRNLLRWSRSAHVNKSFIAFPRFAARASKAQRIGRN